MSKKGENRLVVGSIPWADTVPDWLLQTISEERMVYGIPGLVNEDRAEYVGDAEVVAYLMTSSLRAPIGWMHTRIYTYLAYSVMKRKGRELPEDAGEILKKGLGADELHQLSRLRRELYQARGGEISNPLLDMLRKMKRDAEKEDKKNG